MLQLFSLSNNRLCLQGQIYSWDVLENRRQKLQRPWLPHANHWLWTNPGSPLLRFCHHKRKSMNCSFMSQSMSCAVLFASVWWSSWGWICRDSGCQLLLKPIVQPPPGVSYPCTTALTAPFTSIIINQQWHTELWQTKAFSEHLLPHLCSYLLSITAQTFPCFFTTFVYLLTPTFLNISFFTATLKDPYIVRTQLWHEFWYWWLW